MICCSRNISDYHQCWKQLCCFIFLRIQKQSLKILQSLIVKTSIYLIFDELKYRFNIFWKIEWPYGSKIWLSNKKSMLNCTNKKSITFAFWGVKFNMIVNLWVFQMNHFTHNFIKINHVHLPDLMYKIINV